MNFDVYLIITKRLNRYVTYVGYAKNAKKRLILHNNGKGAKFTKGNQWKLIYKKTYQSKSIAQKEEYILKKNYNQRLLIKKKYLKNENFNTTSI